MFKKAAPILLNEAALKNTTKVISLALYRLFIIGRVLNVMSLLLEATSFVED